MFQHLGHAELLVLRMANFAPQGPAAVAEPGVEFDEGAPASLACFDPDAPPAVLHVLLDDPLLPAAGDVAEVGLEQVVRAHDGEARIDDAALALEDLVHGGLHVVVDAPARDTA